MTEQDRKRLTQILIETDATMRLKELQQKHPDGLMTKSQICDYCGHHNQSRWGDSFVSDLTAYTDGHGILKKYRITDVIAKLIGYKTHEEVYGKKD